MSESTPSPFDDEKGPGANGQSGKPKASKKETQPAKEPDFLPEERLDPRALDYFRHIGFDPVPEKLVNKYLEYKRIKDTFQAGMLSPEGFTTVIILSGVKMPGK